MSLDLSNKDVAALEARTEGWIAGLHLAAIALRGTLLTPGDKEASDFIKSFTGSHRFILDYLIEEVLEQQSESVRAFLLQTAILDRLTGPLCNAVTGQDNGQATLKRLERANLFLVPLDNERRWYRYHHLFADLLRQRLPQSTIPTPGVAELHRRASVWYEENGMELAAFQHAVAAPDIDRAARLVEGGKPGGLPLQFRGAVTPVLNWLASLPTTVLDARPSLWVMYASALSMTGQLSGVEEKLQAAEAALQEIEPDDKTRNLIGHIAAIRALLAATQHQPEAIITQSRRALEYLHPDNLAVRTATTWKLGIAYHLQGDRAAAGEAYAEAISSSQASGNTIINIAATIGLGQVQESENQLYQAAETYQRALELAGEPLQPNAGEAHLGLARIHYEWNDLEAAQEHGQQSFQLAQQMESVHTFADCGVFLARLKLAQGDVMSATAMLEKAEQFVRQHEFTRLAPKIAAAQVRILLRQGNIAAAAQVAEAYELPHSQARVHLAQGDPAAALAALEPWRRRAEARHWADEQLKVKILQAMALQAEGKKDEAVRLSGKALELAAPGGFIRTFVDEGLPMAHLLFEAKNRGIAPDYLNNLLSAFPTSSNPSAAPSTIESSKAEMVEPLTSRELEVLRLIAQGLSNREIGERLFIAVSTVKGHNQNIYSKLQVHRRTEAVARARELELLQP
jgi:LuxR family maltose regulon positive regulatory protein